MGYVIFHLRESVFHHPQYGPKNAGLSTLNDIKKNKNKISKVWIVYFFDSYSNVVKYQKLAFN